MTEGYRFNLTRPTRSDEIATATRSSYPIVKVEWTDASLKPRGWLTLDETLPGGNRVISVGYLIREDENYKTIAGTIVEFYAQDAQFGEVVHIPVGCIKSMKKLRKDTDL